jgi:hypothetical protein
MAMGNGQRASRIAHHADLGHQRAQVPIPVNSATRSNSNPPLIPVKIRHMKQALYLAVECLMAAKEGLVELPTWTAHVGQSCR